MSLQREKILQAVDILKELDIDLWITTGRETSMNEDPVLPLISTIELGQFFILAVTKTGRTVAISGNLDSSGIEQIGVFDEVIPYDMDFNPVFFKFLDEVKPKQIALNYSLEDPAADGLTYGLYQNMMNILKEYNYTGEIISAEEIILKLRGCKTEEELKRMYKGIEITEQIFEDAKSFITVGKTQIDIHKYFVDRCAHYGVETSWQESQCPGVMLGPDTVMGHNSPTDLAAKQGDVITVDFGVKYMDYTTDVQRCYYILADDETEPPAHVVKAFNDVKTAVDKGMEVIKPGVEGWVIDKAARDFMVEENGYPNYNFGFGHQVGRKTHDGGVLLAPRWPRYGDKPLLKVEENMVVTVDVNTRTDRGITGQEDMALVTKDGCKLMTTRQEKIFCVK